MSRDDKLNALMAQMDKIEKHIDKIMTAIQPLIDQYNNIVSNEKVTIKKSTKATKTSK
jgi:hypothetical protein